MVVGCIIQKTIYTYVVYFLYRPVHLGAERTFVQSDATNCASRHRTVQRTHSSNPPSPPTILYVLLAHISAYIIGKIKPSFKKKIQRRNKISPVWFFPCWLITMKNIRFCDVYRKFVYVNRRQHIQNFIMCNTKFLFINWKIKNSIFVGICSMYLVCLVFLYFLTLAYLCNCKPH